MINHRRIPLEALLKITEQVPHFGSMLACFNKHEDGVGHVLGKICEKALDTFVKDGEHVERVVDHSPVPIRLLLLDFVNVNSGACGNRRAGALLRKEKKL